jgi:hypothetical protein
MVFFIGFVSGSAPSDDSEQQRKVTIAMGRAFMNSSIEQNDSLIDAGVITD